MSVDVSSRRTSSPHYAVNHKSLQTTFYMNVLTLERRMRAPCFSYRSYVTFISICQFPHLLLGCQPSTINMMLGCIFTKVIPDNVHNVPLDSSTAHEDFHFTWCRGLYVICSAYIVKYSEELKRMATEPILTERYISYKMKCKLPSRHILFIAYVDYVF
jgi:hypothetical protein